jgi:hypothetical protein
MRWLYNILITFIISGLWHGANWTFVIWGALNGIYLIIEAIFIKQHKKSYVGILLTFMLINFSWIFFRANNINESFYIVKSIFTTPGKLFVPGDADIVAPVYAVLSILILLTVEIKKEFFNDLFTLHYNNNEFVRLLYYCCMVFIIMYIGVFGSNQFIYFQF